MHRAPSVLSFNRNPCDNPGQETSPFAMMRRSLLLATLIFLAVPSGSVAADRYDIKQDEVEQQVQAAERAVGKAIATNDFAALEKLWSPEMLVNSPGNHILTRDQVFAAIRSGQLKYEKQEQTVESFRVYGDVANEMGRETIVPGFGPQQVKTFVRRYTNIWQRTNGSWTQIARQATYTSPNDMYDTKK